MTPGQPDLHLTVAPSNWTQLFPEQAATFDLILHNASDSEATVLSLTGNGSTPILRLFDSQGRPLGQFDPGLRQKRTGGHKQYTPPPPEIAYIRNGFDDGTVVNLWSFIDPLPPGHYSLQASHQYSPEGSWMDSKPVSFEIIPARISSVGTGYSTSNHISAVTSWVASSANGGGAAEALIRLSAPGHLESVRRGAFPIGPIPPATRLSTSGLPPYSDYGDAGWISLIDNSKLELIQHRMARVSWRSGEIPVPVTNLQAVARFPDRGHAVFLGTGVNAAGKPVLAGLRVEADDKRNAAPPQQGRQLQPGPSASTVMHNEPPIIPADPEEIARAAERRKPPARPPLPPYSPWFVPLAGRPVHSMALFEMEGPISVLLVYEEQGKVTFAQIDVDESGKVLAPERVLGASPAKLLGLAVDARQGSPLAFVALMATDPNRPDRLGLLRLPLVGPGKMSGVPAFQGWPTRTENGVSHPLQATETAFEMAQDGTPWFAMVDETGRLFGGPLNGSAMPLLRSKDKCSHPLLAALNEQVSPGCFTEAGLLFSPGHEGH